MSKSTSPVADAVDKLERLTRGLSVARLAFEGFAKEPDDNDAVALTMYILDLEYLAADVFAKPSTTEKAAA